MNISIKTVALNTTDDRVRELSRQLFALEGRRVRITFVKKNGETRLMDCVPRVQFNKTFGIESTAQGCRMVASKAMNDMITVAEIIGSELRPRTVNLRTVIGDIVAISA